MPEALFDMDGPGHYFRRIKTVAVSIPCVTGPYGSVNCTLTLRKSGIRTRPVLRDGVYAREDAEDDRFADYIGSIQSIVTSNAQSDSGMFETNLRDERFWSQGRLNEVVRVEVFARIAGDPTPGSIDVFRSANPDDGATNGTLVKHSALGGLFRGSITSDLPARPDQGEVKLYFTNKEMADVWIALTWSE